MSKVKCKRHILDTRIGEKGVVATMSSENLKLGFCLECNKIMRIK